MTADRKIRLLSMQYEDLAIGLPGYAEEGETLTVQDGVYTLTYDDNVIDSFVMLVGDVDAELAFRYLRNELNLKKQLIRGKSYTFRVVNLSFYQMLKGVHMNGEKTKRNDELELETQTEEFKMLSEEEQLEILQKYDPESNTRDVTGIFKKIVFFGLLAFSIFQLYTAIGTPFTAYIQRSIHLGFALSLIFILFPARKKVRENEIRYHFTI